MKTRRDVVTNKSETRGTARMLSPKEPIMAKMTKNQLIDAIAEATQISKTDVKSVVEQMATAVGLTPKCFAASQSVTHEPSRLVGS